MIRRHVKGALFLFGALLLLLTSCEAAPAEESYYARWKPDEDKIVSLSAVTGYSAAAEVDCSVYDLLDQGTVLLRFETSGRQKAMEDVQYYKDLYESYLAVNDLNIEMTELNLEYSRSKYGELKSLYGENPTKSQRAELSLLLKQISMYEKTQEENRKSREINEKALSNYTSLELDSSLSDEFTSPIEGYLLSLALKKSEETGSFQVGTMISPEDVLLQVDTGGAFSARLGQVLRVGISGQWTNMRVFAVGKTLLLRFKDEADPNLINFMNPLRVELSADPDGTYTNLP